MGIFDRIGNLGKGVFGMWKRADDGPRREQDVLDAELDAVRRKARVDQQLRQIRQERGEEDAEVTEVTEPSAEEAGGSTDSGDDKPIKKTL